MKAILIIFGSCVLLLLLTAVITASIYNLRNDRKPEAREFLAGKPPEPVLNGDYKGEQFTGLGKNWLGKNFNAATNSGINNFAGAKNSAQEQRYPFVTSQVSSLRNKQQTVLQLNYNVAGNPLWLKPIRDELVEVSPNQYLGKIQLKVGFVVITLGYFRLSN